MSATTADARSATVTGQPGAGRLRRSGDDRMLAGVAGGIARYLDADATLVRVLIAALALITGAGAALYLAAWLLIPADGAGQSIAAAWLAGRRAPPANPEPQQPDPNGDRSSCPPSSPSSCWPS